MISVLGMHVYWFFEKMLAIPILCLFFHCCGSQGWKVYFKKDASCFVMQFLGSLPVPTDCVYLRFYLGFIAFL